MVSKDCPVGVENPLQISRDLLKCHLTALFTKPPDGLLPYRIGSGGSSVQQFPIDIFPFCRERPVTKEPAAL